eukprot:428996-Prorocentrum_lima.AAC.1
MEGHPTAQRDWQHGDDIPFSVDMFKQGDIEYPTDMWVEFRHVQPERALVEATSQPNTLPAELSRTGYRRQWLHTTLAGALSALRCHMVLAHEDA